MKARLRLFVAISCLVTAVASVGTGVGDRAAAAVSDSVVEGPDWSCQLVGQGLVGRRAAVRLSTDLCSGGAGDRKPGDTCPTV